MRHPLPVSDRLNWRLVALLIAILTLCFGAALYDSGEARTASRLGHELGSGWTCAPKLVGTVCVKDTASAVTKG